MHCRLCQSSLVPLFTARVLNKHDVAYLHCQNCDLIQTEKPYWLDEAYGTGAMNQFDTGAIARNGLTSQLTSVLARILNVFPDARCGDFGGGHGVFVRMMRDRGLNFHLCDKYADNIFARGFEIEPRERCTLMTSFEVFEHFADPASDLPQLFEPRHDHILVGTVLHRGHRPNWWYYSPQHGQHVAFYSHITMQVIANRFGYQAISGPAYTLFTRADVATLGWRSSLLRRLLEKTRPNQNAQLLVLLDRLLPTLKSRVSTDCESLTRANAA